MNTLRTPPEARQRRHRWVIACTVVAVVLAVYAAGIGWFAHQLEDDLARTIQPLPALEDNQHRSD